MAAKSKGARQRAGADAKVVVVGAGGRLGAAFVRFLSTKGIAYQAFDRGQLSLANPGLIGEMLAALNFDLLINCAAYTSVDDCEAQSSHAYLVNGHAAGQLAQICTSRGARMIHFSTDYVFDGQAEVPYDEEARPNPVNIYGKSKLLGEQQVLASCRSHLVIRLSWLFGPDRPAFPEWVLRQSTSGEVRVVNDKTGCPSYSEDVVRWVDLLLRVPEVGGVFHLCNPPPCTWFEYAQTVLQLTGRKVKAVPISVRDLPGLQAQRPLYSALSCARCEALTGAKCRPWREALTEHLASTA